MIELALLLQNFGSILNDFMRNVRIVDILDIAVISAFLYVVLNWLRQSASRRVLISLTVLFLVYVIARFTGMYLTELLIRGLFIIILIGVVVVFQSDMRRIIDRISNWSFFNNSRAARPASDIATSIITEASAKMAENKTGALIVIKGKEEWERHVHGGIELNGQVTIPLLHSIFNPKAPGHDGAILMVANKILKFGVHLPLSTNLYKMTRGGTRHTAALGISEQCDALVVVVSEERGAISIAQNGQINELESSSDLKKHLDDFWAEHYQASKTSFTHWWKKRSLQTAAGAIGLAFILWLAFAYQWDTVFRTFEVPIEFRNLESTHIALQDSVPLEARITVSGASQAFRNFDPAGLVLSFDLASENIKDGELEITDDDINLPTDMRFYEASPQIIKLKTTHLSSISMPVKIPTSGALRTGLELVSISASPSSIAVMADTTASLPDSISTEPINLNIIQKSETIQKRLQLNNKSIELPDETPEQVTIEIKIRKN